MNMCMFMGRLTRDPEIFYTDNNLAVARFSIAVNRIRRKGDDESSADFFRCIAYRERAEFVAKYLRQGQRILVWGRMENDNYTAKDGSKVYGCTLQVDNVEFADGKDSAGPAEAAPQEQSQTSAEGVSAAQSNAAPRQNAGAPRQTAQRGGGRAPARNTSGSTRRAPARQANQPAADGFMNVGVGDEGGLPFN